MGETGKIPWQPMESAPRPGPGEERDVIVVLTLFDNIERAYFEDGKWQVFAMPGTYYPDDGRLKGWARV